MPQLSLYVDKETFSKIERGANAARCSISKFVSQAVNERLVDLKDEWPDGFFALCGSLGEEDLIIPDDMPPNLDTKRETLS
jgi:hypothetical protein